ncbi:cutinase transcription factor 1 beta [Fusarium langsethiae]|uniref:Cutinase transcription factor 1 beta n=1 Tax=Fusarium langsethiae TaxID=179993 RepID=A0A0M9ENN1_FUSLA|nr:cutinase transcription factor 1 beta [Fusarium langsethiae]
MEPPPRTTHRPHNRQGGSKRLKIDVACDHCRTKKVKCDGVRPVCGTCNRKLALRDSCNYTASSVTQNSCRVSIPKEHNGNKTSPCVQEMQRNDVCSSSILGTQPQPPRRSSNPPQQHYSSPSTSTPGSRIPESYGQRKAGASLPSTSPSAIDSMTAVIDEGASTGEFFGRSSAGSFTAQIKKAIDVRLGRPTTNSQGNPSNVSRLAGAINSTTSTSFPSLSYVLPPRRQADHLMELYWFYVDPLYPFLDRTRWSRAYNAIFAGTAMDLDERIFVATLNVILALSTQLLESQSLDQREQTSETFFHRAQELLPMSPWEPGSLELDSRYKEKETHSDLESSDGEDDDLDRVVQLDRCISRWESRLPNHLRWDFLGSNSDKIAQRQAVILRMRFLHARILLLRPVLSRFCLSPFPSERPQAEDNLQARVIQQSAMFCVTTAQNMINTLVTHQSMDSTVGLLPAWWYRVYYVYSAATVLIAAKLRPDVFSAAEIGQSWGQAISLLKTHEQFGQSAKRCVTALHILSSKILQATSRGSLGRDVTSTNNGIMDQDIREDQISPHMMPDMESLDRVQQLVQGFESPVPDFNPRDFADFDFNVNDMSWLNDIQGVWELLNE